MFSHVSQDVALPFRPVPEHLRAGILGPVDGALENCMFDRQAIRVDHVYTSRHPQGTRVHRAAFTDPHRWDPTTSGVNYYYNPDRLPAARVLEWLALSGAPFNLIGDEEHVSLFALSGYRHSRPDWELVEHGVDYSRLVGLFARLKPDIMPQSIQQAKRGASAFLRSPEFSPVQLSLWAVHLTEELLADRFAGALRAGMPLATPAEDVPTTAIQLLAAIILAEKEVFGEEFSQPDLPLRQLFGRAVQEFPRYFRSEIVSGSHGAADEIYRRLRLVRYTSFTPDVLQSLYVKAYPDLKTRRREGRYNTSLWLTRQILDNIPVEALPPRHRVVADMTCGVGNFLQAAYDRLRRLPDMDTPLRQHIVGNDADEFTSKLAGMSMLLTSLSDRWHVDAENALTWRWLDRNQPGVIVGNPPFSGSRRSGERATRTDPNTGKRRRHELALEFLDRAIERVLPGGYLAMIVPRSFTTGQAGRETRQRLLDRCDVTELWELPDNVFTDAKVRPLVVFAQRRQDSSAGPAACPVRTRAVQRRSLETFRETKQFTATGLVTSQGEWLTAERRMEYHLVLSRERWQELRERCVPLEDEAHILLGASIGGRERHRHTKYEVPVNTRVLRSAKRVLPRPWVIQYAQAEWRLYPNEFERPRLTARQLLLGHKVIVVSDPDPSWGQRVVVAIDRQGCVPSDSFWVLAPKSKTSGLSLEVLAAVVSWCVGNAWIVEHLTSPKIKRFELDSLPIPSCLSSNDCDRIRAAVWDLERAAENGLACSDAQTELDDVLTRAYGLDEATLAALRRVADWDSVDPRLLLVPPPDPMTMIHTSGKVESIDARKGEMVVQIAGCATTSRATVTPEMPGWMLRPGACFQAMISEEHYRQTDLRRARWSEIQPVCYSYLEGDDLLDQLSSALSAGLSRSLEE